ncbi:MAG TPA: hypothetical protein VNL69_01135 [Bacteroidota bacterium]|nr:hypothetical protein [Bacteroidota bacterium]
MISDRMMRFALFWFTLTTVIFWLPTVRGAFDGDSYVWGLLGLGGRGVGGDYLFPVLASASSIAVIGAGWRQRTWAYAIIAVWSVLMLVAVTVAVVLQGEEIRFRGDTLGVDVSLAWIGPLVLGLTAIVSCLACWRAYRHSSRQVHSWSTQNRRWLVALAALLPIQFVLLRVGDPASLLDQVGVIITIMQWLFLGWVFRPYKNTTTSEAT